MREISKLRFLIILILSLIPFRLFADYGFSCKYFYSTNGYGLKEFFIDDDFNTIGIIDSQFQNNVWTYRDKPIVLKTIKKTDDYYIFENIDELWIPKMNGKKEKVEQLYQISRRGDYILSNTSTLQYNNDCLALSEVRISEGLKLISNKKIEILNKIEAKKNERQKEINSNKF